MTTYIGIDNGLDGGLAAVRGNELLWKYPMPTESLGKSRVVDARKLACLIEEWSRDEATVTVEQASKHSPGVLSLCSTWHSFGSIEALLKRSGIRFHVVTPIQWQRTFWTRPKLSKNQKFDTKAAALAAARRIWPKVEWTATKRSRVPHDGIIDAALIAEFSRRQNL